MKSRVQLSFILALAALAACETKPAPAPQAAAPAAAPGAPITPCPTCKVIVIGMTTTETGNFFDPKDVEAHEGDVLRFKLNVGVHNANFLPDSNPGKPNLPPATALLQLPGQTADILLNFGTGNFYFQCDAHAALGMRGHLKVEKKESE